MRRGHTRDAAERGGPKTLIRYALASGRLCTILCRRFSRKRFENTIELRERLKSSREGDFTDAQFRVPQKVTGSFEASAGDIIGKNLYR